MFGLGEVKIIGKGNYVWLSFCLNLLENRKWVKFNRMEMIKMNKVKIIYAVFGLEELKIIGKGNYVWLSLREVGINGEKAI